MNINGLKILFYIILCDFIFMRILEIKCIKSFIHLEISKENYKGKHFERELENKF